MTKEEAITFLKCDRERTCYDFKIGHCDGCNVRTALDMAIVALKAEPVHGHWDFGKIAVYRGMRCSFICSACGEGVHKKWCYCPNCGAKMDGVET